MFDINIKIQGNYAVLTGELIRQNITKLDSKPWGALFANDCAKVDLAQVSKVDSAGLAWLLYLVEIAGAESCQLSFTQLPSKLHKLIELSGVTGFLPIAIDE